MKNTIAVERALIGSAMMHPDFTDTFVAELTEDSFTDGGNKCIYRAIADLRKAGQAVTTVTVIGTLPASAGLSAVDVACIEQEAAIYGSERSCIQILKDAHARRIFIAGLRQAIQQADAGEDGYMDAAQAAIDAANSLGSCTAEPIGAYIDEAIAGIAEHFNGTKTGIKKIDALTGGLHGGDLIVIGARPSVGKTAFATNIAVNVAKQGKQVAFFSLEMKEKDLAQRIAQAWSRVSREQALSPYSEIRERAAAGLAKAADEIKEPSLPLTIIDKSTLTFHGIRSECYGMKQSRGLDLIVIDYLGLIKTTQRKNGTREQEVAELSRSFKLLAREMNVPVILLSQLNRAIANRANPTPTLADLRESGAIEQDADVVVLIADGESDNEREIRIAKNRNGATGKFSLYYRGECFLFDNI